MKKLSCVLFWWLLVQSAAWCSSNDAGPSSIAINPISVSATGEIRWKELFPNGIHYVGFKAPDSIIASKIWTLPSADGSSGQVMSTNGSGVLSWVANGSGSVTSISAGAPGSITGTSGLTFSASPITSTGSIAIANLGVSTPLLADLSVTTAKINDLGVTTGKLAAEAVTMPKLVRGTSGRLLIAQGGADTAYTAMSGDATITNAGALTIANLAVTTAKINDQAVTMPKLVRGTSGQLLIGQGGADTAYTAMSGDATITNAGALTIANSAVTTAKINDAAVTPIKLSGDSIDNSIVCGRLTAQSGTPIPSAVSSTTNLYFTPFKGNRIALYSGGRWKLLAFSETSITVPSTKYRMFDVFAYDNAGTVTFETVNWDQSTGTNKSTTSATEISIASTSHGLSNGQLVFIEHNSGSPTGNFAQIEGYTFSVSVTDANNFKLLGTGNMSTGSAGSQTINWYRQNQTRATGLTTQDSVLVKSGDTTRRYLGTCCTNATSGQIEDSDTKRFVFNYYHQTPRRLLKQEATGSWDSSHTAWQTFNGEASGAFANRVEFIVGYGLSYIDITFHATCLQTGGNVIAVGLGLSSSSANIATAIQSVGANAYGTSTARWNGHGVEGYFYMQMMERPSGATSRFFGNSGVDYLQSALVGSVNN
jgi:hypothetical protein